MENNQPEKQDILLIETLPVLSTPANIKNRHGIDIQQFRSAENNEQDAAVIEKHIAVNPMAARLAIQSNPIMISEIIIRNTL